MRSRIVAIILFVLACQEGYSQFKTMPDLKYKSKWQVRPVIGVSFPHTKLFKGYTIDDLVQYTDDRSTYLQVIAVTWFFKRHWGIELTYQGNSADRIGERHNRFINNINSEYGANYYVDASSGAFYTTNHAVGGDFGTGFIGIVYRKEAKNFYVYPKLNVGVTSFYTDWGDARLKQKNSNTYLEVEYRGDDVARDYLALAPSLSMGYKLSKRFFLNLDVMTSYFRANFGYTKTITDLYTMEVTTENFNYRKGMITTSIGLGLIVVIK